MKNATAKKKATHKKKAAPARKKAAATTTVQPQSKLQAAKQAGVFLHTDDQWSLAYFDPKDLHCVERALFG